MDVFCCYLVTYLCITTGEGILMTCAWSKITLKTHSVALLNLERGRNKQQLPHNTFSWFLIGWKNVFWSNNTAYQTFYPRHSSWFPSFFRSTTASTPPLAKSYNFTAPNPPVACFNLSEGYFCSWQALRNSTQCHNHHSVWAIWSTLNTYCPNIYQTISGSSSNITSSCDQLLPKKRIGL